MTAKEALAIIRKNYPYQEFDLFRTLEQALTELEAIKSVDDSVVLVGLVKLLHNYLFRADDLIIINNIKNYILKAQAQERELRELKATIKELLDIPITVSTFNGTSLLVKTMNKLNKLVSDKDE